MKTFPLKSILSFIVLGGMMLVYFRFLDGTVVHPVVSFSSMTIQTEKNTYKAGEIIRAKISFCKYRKITPTVTDTLVGTFPTFYLPKFITIGEIGCKDEFIELEQISPNKTLGIYHLNRELIYKPTYLRSIKYYLTTNDFEVIK